jgi:hypothetical protein
VLRQDQICDRQKFCASALATLIALTVWAMPTARAFADLSPEFSDSTVSAEANPSLQLAEANLGSVDDYMHQDGDGPSTSAVPSQGYSSQPIPPQNYYPQGAPPPEWNNGYANPDTERSALIGAAVVGALAVGLWAWQQHELQQSQSQRYVPPRRRHHRRAVE